MKFYYALTYTTINFFKDFPFLFVVSQLKWSQPPVCYLPESLRGLTIKDLNSDRLDDCLEFIHDEGHDAASTSHNFLEQGHLNILAFFAATVFILLAIIILAAIMCYTRQRARYYTNEEKRAGESLTNQLFSEEAEKLIFRFSLSLFLSFYITL
jgi:hypothetical protein